MDLKNVITDLLERHPFPSIQAQFHEAPDTIRARVGFVGEFSSGKSTLINAMVGRKVLPARTDPTTGNVITLEAVEGLVEPERFAVQSDGTLRNLGAVAFSEIAMGQVPGLLAVHVPPTPTLAPGLQLIDTPGLNSLLAGHSDLTMTQLSLLDGIVVCLHQQHGAIPASLLTFLRREEIAEAANRLLFAMTFADLKSAEAASRIREKFEEELRAAIPTLTGPVKMAFTDSLAALEGDPDGILAFTQSFREAFVLQSERLRQERHGKHLRETGGLLNNALRQELSAIGFDDAAFNARDREVKGKIEAVRLRKSQEHARLETWQIDLNNACHELAMAFTSRFANAEIADLDNLSAELDLAMQKVATAKVQSYASAEPVPIPGLMAGQAAALVDALKTHAKYVDRGVTLATLAATIAITAGAGAGAVAAEEAGAAAAASQAGAKEIVKKSAKEAVKGTAQGAAKEAAKKGFFKRALEGLATVMKEVNPLELAGDVVRSQWNGHEAALQLPQIAGNLSKAVAADLKAHLDRTCFLPLEQELQAAEEGLHEARAARTEALDQLSRRKEDLRKDLRILEQAMAVH
jgi:hypothetical protein